MVTSGSVEQIIASYRKNREEIEDTYYTNLVKITNEADQKLSKVFDPIRMQLKANKEAIKKGEIVGIVVNKYRITIDLEAYPLARDMIDSFRFPIDTQIEKNILVIQAKDIVNNGDANSQLKEINNLFKNSLIDTWVDVIAVSLLVNVDTEKDSFLCEYRAQISYRLCLFTAWLVYSLTLKACQDLFLNILIPNFPEYLRCVTKAEEKRTGDEAVCDFNLVCALWACGVLR